MKRSASPQTVSDTDQAPKRSRFSGFLSTLKTAFGKSTEKNKTQSPFTNPIEDTFPTNFTSRKRRESIQESLKAMNQLVPRSSASGKAASYQTLSSSLQLEKEAMVNDSEQRRMSVVNIVADYDAIKEQSPTFNTVPKNQILPTNPKDMDLDYEEELPIVIEHEFAPLYEDGNGNLVRPPFINLDPRERYHLLQLKKSIEASEFLQNRLKYMVDPDETTSITRQNNKVESSTQTYNKEYLDKSLHFTALRTKLALANRKQRRSKKGRGMFSGDFYYEPAEKKVEEPKDSKLSGYLGGLNQPSFKDSTKPVSKKSPDDDSEESNRKRTKSASQRAGLEELIRTGQTKDTFDEPKNLSSIIKVKDLVSPQKKPTAGPGSGFNFEINKKDFSSILQKRTEDEKLVQESSTPSTFGAIAKPSEAVKFGEVATPSEIAIPKETVKFGGAAKPAESFKPTLTFKPTETAKSTKRGRDEETEPASKPAFSFGAPPLAPKDPAVKPAFSFGKPASEAAKPASEITKPTTEAPKPAFSFGVKPTEGKKDAAPSFSFGGAKATEEKKEATPIFSFGNAKPTETPKPAFSFGATNNTKETGEPPKTPSLLFGVDTKKSEPSTGLFGLKPAEESKTAEEKKDEALKVSFGTTTPSFSFEKKDPAPAFAFGKSDAPKFSFGALSGELKDNSKPEAATEAPKTPAFGSVSSTPVPEAKEDKTKEEAPKFSFGAKPAEAPKFSFGKSESTPSFSFATKPEDKKELSEPPKFSFGQTSMPATETKPDTKPMTPSFSFGKETQKETTPVFSFSSKETTPKPLFGTDNTAKPAFSFGNLTAPATLAPFSFGNSKTPEATKPAASNFSFGLGGTADPAQIFGGGGAAPAFNFAAPKELSPFGQSAAKRPANFGGATTPSFGGATTPSFGGATSAPFSFGGANNLAAPTPQMGAANNGFGSRVSTPTSAPGFGQAQSMPNPASVFGAPNSQTTGFSFSANNGGNTTPGFGAGMANPGFGAGPAGPGSFGLASRENTPPVFGGAPGFNGQTPGQLFTPPLAAKGRKIAQMRPRKRY